MTGHMGRLIILAEAGIGHSRFEKSRFVSSRLVLRTYIILLTRIYVMSIPIRHDMAGQGRAQGMLDRA